MSRLRATLQGCLALILFATLCSAATAAPWAFIANTDSKSVTIIDTATHTVAKTLAMTDTPYEFAVTSTAAYVCGDGSALAVISLPSLTLAAPVPLGRSGCEAVIANKAGTILYVTFNNFGGNNSVVALNTGTLQKTSIDLPATPTIRSAPRAALNFDESVLYAVSGGSVYLIKTAPTLQMLGSILIGAPELLTNYIETNRTGGTAYVSAWSTKQVFAVDTSNGTFVPINLSSAAQSIALAPDTRYAWVPNTVSFSTAPIASIIDTLNGNTVAGTVTVPRSSGDSPSAVDFTPDGNFAYIITDRSSVEPGNVKVIRIATGQVQATIPVGTNPWNRGRFIGPRSAPAIVTVPNVVGLSQSAAEAAIAAAGLALGVITQQASASVPAGNVISQNPAAGANAATGTLIAFVVSSGAPVGGTTGPYAFVPNFNSNTVTIIDTATGALVKTVAAGTQPNAVAITPGAVYVCAYGSTAMSVINLPDLSASADIPVPGGCQCIVANKAGTTVYASGGAQGLFVLNTATRQYTTLQMPGSIGNLLLSPDESTLIATHPSAGKISLISLAPSIAIARTITVAGQPYGMDINKSGRTLYVAIYDKAAVHAYDLFTDTFVSIPVGQVPVQVALTPDGNALYVTNSGSNTVSIINSQNNTVNGSINAGKQPYGVDFTNDGTFAYVVNQDPSAATGNVSVVRTATGQVEKTIATGKLPQAVGRFIGPRNDAAGTIAVPNVVGLTEPAASAAIFGANLTLGTISTASSATVASGLVISQSPAANASVAARTPVSLVISIGPSAPTTVTVPNVIGLTEPAASAAIFAAGLKLGSISTGHSSTIPADRVMTQTPAANASAAFQSTVSLVISIGPAAPTAVVIPNVTGMTEPAASAAIFAAGLRLGSISTTYSATVASGSVISTSPPANTSVPFQSQVGLVISIGPPIVVVEFYHAPLDHYFITADPNEQKAIDNGSAGPGWSRTGDSFLSGGARTVCRFYGNANANPSTGTIYGPNSHFYTAATDECESLKQAYNPNVASWHFEGNDFRTTLPGPAGCEASQMPVYRAYNNGFTRKIESNHRLTPNPASIQQVVARGWTSEGIVMCAPK